MPRRRAVRMRNSFRSGSKESVHFSRLRAALAMAPRILYVHRARARPSPDQLSPSGSQPVSPPREAQHPTGRSHGVAGEEVAQVLPRERAAEARLAQHVARERGLALLEVEDALLDRPAGHEPIGYDRPVLPDAVGVVDSMGLDGRGT